MKLNSKILFSAFVYISAIFLAIFVIIKTPAQDGQAYIFQFSRDVILFVCSTLVSWMTSAWFSAKESNNKIDAIAERSFEKMAMLTLQIERAKKFLVDTIKLSQSEIDPVLGMSSYKHRINGSIAGLDQISASNDTFRADWLGVVSPAMKEDLAKKLEALSNVQEIVNELSKGAEADGQLSDLDRKIQSAEREVAGAGKFIGELKSRSPSKMPVAQITQEFEGAQSDTYQAGTLKINVSRFTYRATGTGALDPHMCAKPTVEIELVAYPAGLDISSIRFPVGVGTNFNFNIGLQSAAHGQALPLGVYAFRFVARASQPSD